MAAAAAADSFSGGGSGAVRLPRSPPFKVLAEQLRRDAEGGPDRVTPLRAWPLVFGVRLTGFSSSLGKYVMVMGVVQACSPEPCLQAVKMTELSDNPVHESMWGLEVEDLHRNTP
ncbi:PREDICTED: recQ-mediated genome instability protein 2 [Condylura cristata]|uniref:recQ-mediated genome instability protein 2 n=1 Tax=Condylura cristata TaxID=143302 RepID=UPI000642C053|nr:PREDICTED: recQ-mediated genome instability protein 2 [Condylura cristata]